MRKLVVYALLSVDGVAESPDRYIFDFDQEMDANMSRVIETQDAVLLGRRTYDEWAGYWPTADHEPFASFINSTQKNVASSTAPQAPWENTTLIEGSVPDFVLDLKEQPGPTSVSTGASSWRVPCSGPASSTSSGSSSHRWWPEPANVCSRVRSWRPSWSCFAALAHLRARSSPTTGS